MWRTSAQNAKGWWGGRAGGMAAFRAGQVMLRVERYGFGG